MPTKPNKKSINEQILGQLKGINKEVQEIHLLISRGMPNQGTIPQTSNGIGKDLTKPDLITLHMKPEYTAQYLFDECKKLFPCYTYLDLSNIISDRKGDYEVSFKNVQEADEENKSLSADELKEKGIKGTTLEERLLMELEYFKKTGNHLDIDNLTLCSGSRYDDGRVPYCCWRDGEFGVSRYDSDDRRGSIRARSVVSSS